MKFRALCIAALLGAAIWLMSCGHYICHTTLGASTCNATGTGKSGGGGGGTNNNLTTVFAYFIDASGGIAAEALNLGGVVSYQDVPTNSPISLGGQDSGIVIVNKKYLYVASWGGNGTTGYTGNLYGFSINGTTAALTAVPNSPYAVNGLATANGIPVSIAADPLGRFIFVSDPAGISVYAINSTNGSLTLQNATPSSTGIGAAIQMATDGLGKYLYVMDGTSIAEFAYASGALTPVSATNPTFPGPPNIQMLVSEPSGKYMLGITKGLGGNGTTPDDNVYTFAITQAGGTNPGSLGTPVVFNTGAGTSPNFITVHPNGKIVYTFNVSQASSGFSREPINIIPFSPTTGALGTPKQFTDVLADSGLLDQTGGYMIVIGQETIQAADGVIPVTVAADGSLSVSTLHSGDPGPHFAVTDAP